MPANCTQSESSYMGGCRCDDCRQAHTDRERERRHSKRKQDPEETKTTRRLKPLPDYYDYDTYTRGDIGRARGWDD